MMRFAIDNLVRLTQIYYHYLKRSVVVPYLPIFAGIETTGACNLRCVMCPHGQERFQSRARGHMSFDIFCRVVDEAKRFIFDADLFGGGEPLLNPRIFDMIAYARSAGLRSRLHTNATLMDEQRARRLLGSGLDFLSFSFEGFSKETYESVRANASYEITLSNIERFLELKARSKQRLPYTVLQIIQVDPAGRAGNFDVRLNQLRRIFASHPGLNEFKVIPLHNYGGKVAGVTRERATNYTPCTFLWYAIYVLWDGTIVPCCVDWWGEWSMGNIADMGLEQAWHGNKMRELRERIGSGRYPEIALCGQCDRLWRPERMGVPSRSMGVVRQWVTQHILGY
jgi:MoaA/NifB/PqqE/SkfB family radical SAM enzyme